LPDPCKTTELVSGTGWGMGRLLPIRLEIIARGAVGEIRGRAPIGCVHDVNLPVAVTARAERDPGPIRGEDRLAVGARVVGELTDGARRRGEDVYVEVTVRVRGERDLAAVG
jgi:hypothetical protein